MSENRYAHVLTFATVRAEQFVSLRSLVQSLEKEGYPEIVAWLLRASVGDVVSERKA